MVHYNIFKPGEGFSRTPDEDFNAEFGLNENDIVIVPAGFYPWIEIGKLQNIIFRNEGGQVITNNINFGVNAIGPKIWGNGVGDLKYGFKTVGENRFGISLRSKGEMEVTGWQSVLNVIGIQMISTPEEINNGVQNLKLTNCLIENPINEAIYLGYHIVGGMWITALVQNCFIKNSGADGIQCRNGHFVLLDNLVDTVGINGDANHSQGLLFGGNTNGSIAKNNRVVNVAGYGLFINGFGTFDIECNEFQCNSSGVFTKNYENDQDLQKVGYQTVNIKNNIITPGNGFAFEHLYHDNGIPVTINAYNNRTSGTMFRESDKLIFNGEANEPNVVPNCDDNDEIFYHKGYFIKDGKRIYYKIWKSTNSPTGYIIRIGNYTWYKQAP